MRQMRMFLLFLLLVSAVLGGVVPGGMPGMAQVATRTDTSKGPLALAGSLTLAGSPGRWRTDTSQGPQHRWGTDTSQGPQRRWPTDTSEGLERWWDTLMSYRLDEKVFVHTDKDFYLAGEICWFKCYDVAAGSHQPLTLSKIAYVEVLDTSGRPVLQAKIALAGGSGSGSFYLPFTLASGTYTLRSYTNWMKNSSAEFFFYKKFTVINTREAVMVSKVPAAVTPPAGLLGFFPEGGNLVNGLPSIVAFKGTDAYGDPIDFTGILLDEKNDTLLRFNPLTLGMGHFSFTPAAGHSYRALIQIATVQAKVQAATAPAQPATVLVSPATAPAQPTTVLVSPATAPAQPAAVPADFTVALPEAYAEGYVMHLDTATDGQLTIDVQTNKTGEGALYLFVHTQGYLCVAEGKSPANGHAVFRIEKSRLGEGISHLTVFNSARQPVCERLYFRYPADRVRLSLETDRTEYHTREPVNVAVGVRVDSIVEAQAASLRVGGTSTEVPQADLSMAVYRLDSLQGIDPGNIYSYLWLTSDLMGPIASPDYYFDRPGPESAAAMDNLMLTQGWRRFRWESVLKDNKPSFTYPPEYGGHIISGTVVDTRTGRPAPGMESFLSIPGKRTRFATARSDSAGRVLFEMRDMYGSSEMIVQTNLAVDSLYRVDMDDPFSEIYPRGIYSPLDEYRQNPATAPAYKVTMSAHNLSMQIQNVYSAMKAQQLELPVPDSSAFYQEPDQTYNLDDYTRFTTMEEVLREYIKLVSLSKKGAHYHLWTHDAPHDLPFSDDPLMLLDGVPIFNTDQFMQFDPFKIRKVDVLTRRYFLGGDYFDGILNWVTYRGDLSGYPLDPHAIAVDYDGLQAKREFYSPVYATPGQKASRLPDFRNVLYWDPAIRVPESGIHASESGIHTSESAIHAPESGIHAAQSVRFYTSDLGGKYIVVVQGIGSGGEPLYGTTTLTVQKH
jgi:hypothetical protein